jgi:hypothetical protein
MLNFQNTIALIFQNLDNFMNCPFYLPELAPCSGEQVVEASLGRSLRLSG